MTALKRLFLAAAFLASGAAAGLACDQVIEKLDDPASDVAADYDAMRRSERVFKMIKARPTENILRFFRQVEGEYLRPKDNDLLDLRSADLAKLIGYAIGEAATKPAPVDVFAPGFQTELEQWVVRLSAVAGVDASAMWRLIEESAHGFYDEEMRAAYGASGHTSVEAWFKELTASEQRIFLSRIAGAGLADTTGAPFTSLEFAAISVLMDANFDRENYSDEERRAFIYELAAGKAPANLKE